MQNVLENPIKELYNSPHKAEAHQLILIRQAHKLLFQAGLFEAQESEGVTLTALAFYCNQNMGWVRSKTIAFGNSNLLCA